ncbi:hypothetical protein LIER_21450 [Lithospermum erythrorhizon]|uniref:NB-ARC domain-containing protein n=1 Tax=Lithospermum erythrorhizon TaxID=34254 RepID=A0AAV3QRH0_LITER
MSSSDEHTLKFKKPSSTPSKPTWVNQKSDGRDDNPWYCNVRSFSIFRNSKATLKVKQRLRPLRLQPHVGYPAPIEQRPFRSPLEVIGFRSRLQVEERVMKALLDDEIPVLAVCGMGGVGKTTMVKKARYPL